MELLLSQSSIAVNPRNKVNETPLHYASRKGYKEVIELLVKHGGDVTIAGQHGMLHNKKKQSNNDSIKSIVLLYIYTIKYWINFIKGTSQDVAVDFGQNEIAKLLDKMKKQQK